MARVLLCPERRTAGEGRVEACGGCRSCGLLSHDPNHDDPTGWPHPDLHVIQKELAAVSSNPQLRQRKQMNIPVDLLREHLLGGRTSDQRFHESAVYQSSVLGGGKVFIINEAHLLDLPGQNALLKAMEEPPRETFLILVTTSLDKLLMTVRSRCQPVAFVPLGDEVIANWLESQPATLSPRQRDWVVEFASGSLGMARLAVEYDLFGWAEAVLSPIDEMYRGRYPVELGGEMARLIDAFAKRWVERHGNASKDAANKKGAGLMWRMISQHARGKLTELAARYPSGDPGDPGSPGDLDPIYEPWLRVIDALEQAQSELAANVNLGLVMDHLVSLMHRSLAGSAGVTLG